MANPRLLLGFEEQGMLLLSFKTADTNLSKTNFNTNVIVAKKPGLAVSMSAAQSVSLGSAGDRLTGVVQSVDTDGIVSVQVTGTVKLIYTSTAPTVGHSVQCHGDGTVEVATSNNVDRGNTVYDIDTTNHYVWVRLG